MKLHTQDRELMKGGTGEESTFSIKATSKAFAILSSGLYSNKILAIVRELSCNAYDAHVAAGNKETPIEINLPTQLKPVFSVKDFGVGLDHEGVTQLYTTYFESTKQDSDDFIGALGLGSKSPFSYVSSFNVEARFNGVKRLYTAFINEKGLPSITKMNEEPTTEGNGLTISLAVKRDDMDTFHREAQKALMYFNPMPIVRGVGHFQPYSLTHTVVGSNWKVRATEYSARMEGPFIIQGFVAYPVDSKQLREHNISSTASACLGVDLDIVVPMGDVEVAASREALSYDPRTIKNLTKHLEAVAAEMRTTIQKEFDVCKTYWEVACVANKFEMGDYKFREIYSGLNRKAPFTWNNKPVNHTVTVPFIDVKSTSIIRMSFGSYGDRKLSVDGKADPSKNEQAIMVPASFNALVVVDDMGKGGNAVIEAHLKTLHPNTRQTKPSVVILRPVDKKSFNTKEIDTIIANMGNPEYVYTSRLPQVAKQKSAYVKRDTSTRLVWSNFPQDGGHRKNQTRRVFSRLCWKPTTIDMAAGGFYVPVERFTIVNGTNECNLFDQMLAAARSLFAVNYDTVCGFNEKEIDQVKNNPKWINLFSHLEKEFINLNVDNKIVDSVVAKEAIGNLRIERLVSEWKNICGTVLDGGFKITVDSIIKMRDSSDVIKDTVNKFLESMSKTDVLKDISNKRTKIEAEWSEMVTQYEMLKLINWHHVEESQFSMIVNYVNIISAKG